MRFTEKLRQAWDDLFHSSLISRLEEDLMRVRQDFELRIQEYQNIVADLRNEKAALSTKLAIFEFSLQQKAGIDPSRMSMRKPSFANFAEQAPMTRWQQTVAQHEATLAAEEAKEAASAAKV